MRSSHWSVKLREARQIYTNLQNPARGGRTCKKLPTADPGCVDSRPRGALIAARRSPGRGCVTGRGEIRRLAGAGPGAGARVAPDLRRHLALLLRGGIL